MVTKRLLPLMGGVLLLAAAPAFAQSETKPAAMGDSANTAGAPAQDQSNQGQTDQQQTQTQPMHRYQRHAMRSQSGRAGAQDQAVDDLNNQSLQAAKQGQPFSPGSGGQGMNGSQGMNGGQGASSGMQSGKM